LGKYFTFGSKSEAMKFRSPLRSAFFPFLILLGLVLVAGIARRGDSEHLSGKRAWLARHISASAAPFRDRQPSGESRGEKETDAPELASLQEYFSTLDPADQRVHAERLVDAGHDLELLKQNRLKSGGYELQWTGTDAEMGGRTRAILWDPLVNNKVWAGGVTGGLWYNPDITSADSRWTPVNDFWDNLAISCLTYDPNQPLTMYAGTGEAQTALITYRESGGRGVGIWKTTDGGQSWELIPSTSGFAYVTKIVVRNEGGSSVIYAGVVSGYYHGQQQSAPSDGLFRSADGGNTWQQVLPNMPGQTVPYGISDVAVSADGRIYAGTMPNMDGIGGGVILYSDAGTPGTWTVFSDYADLIPTLGYLPIPGRVVLAVSPSNPAVVYAAISAGIHDPGTQPIFRGVFILRTSNRGGSWTDIPTPDGDDVWANLAWHAMTLAVDPNNPDVLWAGGLDVWRTQNAGNSWEHLSDWAMMYNGGGATYVHADQQTIVPRPGSSSDILFGCDGGVFMTQNGNVPKVSLVFQEKNKGYNTLQFYTCALHPGAGEEQFLGGLQDNGSLLYQGTPLNIGSMISGGDGSYCFWDKDNPSVYLTSVYYNRYYIFTNGGMSNYGDEESGVFINPADYSSQYNTLYANAADFWGTNADKLLRVSNIPVNGYGYFLPVNSGCNTYFSHIKVSPYTTGGNTTVFAGSATGQLYRINKANAFPETTEIGSPDFPAGSISCVATGGSEDTLLVTFSNYGVNSLWQTCDGGQNWRSVEGNLPDMPVRWAIYHPQNSRQAMIATELGVWTSSNLNADNVVWTPQTSGMANVRVDMLTLRESDHTVLAASHGRGLFTCNFPLDLNTSQPELTRTDEPLMVYSGKGTLSVQPGFPDAGVFVIYSMSGRQVLSGKLSGGGSRQTLNTRSLSAGIYLLEVSSGKRKQWAKVVL
jgi:photosystem II stability/assembly factor-like uncharacterized protein